MSNDNSGPAYPSSNKLKCGDVVTNGHTGYDAIAMRAYSMADAMLAEREK